MSDAAEYWGALIGADHHEGPMLGRLIIALYDYAHATVESTLPVQDSQMATPVLSPEMVITIMDILEAGYILDDEYEDEVLNRKSSMYYETMNLQYFAPAILPRASLRNWIVRLVKADPDYYHTAFNKLLQSTMRLYDPMTERQFIYQDIPRSCFPATADLSIKQALDERELLFKGKAKGIVNELQPSESLQARPQQMLQLAQQIDDYTQSHNALVQAKARLGAAQKHSEMLFGREYIDQWGRKRRTEGMFDNSSKANF
jgi:hypothetical protein